MIKAYINIEKAHEKLISCLNSYDLDSVDLDKIASQSEVNLVCTSFSLYGKTKKNLSNNVGQILSNLDGCLTKLTLVFNRIALVFNEKCPKAFFE